MKLVIDIPEETYKGVLELWKTEKDRRFREVIHEAIVNGIPYEDRQQGEWIKEPNDKTTDLYICSVCNRSIMLCKDADLAKYPFCHCGADMRGGRG